MAVTPNYNWPVPVATDYVKDGWEAISDLGNAIDTTVAGLGSGLNLITSQSFTTASTVNVNDVFSATYKNYRVILNVTTASTAGGYNHRLRVSGADNTTSNYRYHRTYWNTGGSGNQSSLTGTAFAMGSTAQNGAFYSIDYSLPFASERTGINGFGVNNETGDLFKELCVGTFNATTSFTGFSIFADSGTITGTVKVYGYED